jgi:serine/threonine protein kinase
VIHRDIKPNNVMLTRDDKVKLTDFGIAKDVHSELTLTKPKDLLGTPAYMAPEQFDGAQNASIRSDIYSLAATLYSAVTGKIPFNGRTWLAILTRKLHHGLPSPRQVVPSLSETMERAILHGLHPDPEKRPATCLEFLAELEANTPVPLAFLEKHESALVAVRQQHLVHVERRKQLRHRVRGTARYQGKSPGKVKSIFDRAILVDVSPAGVQLCVQDGFKVGETLKVELLTPQGVPVLTREARVCWAHSAPGELYFRLGCQWIEPLTPQDLLGFA